MLQGVLIKLRQCYLRTIQISFIKYALERHWRFGPPPPPQIPAKEECVCPCMLFTIGHTDHERNLHLSSRYTQLRVMSVVMNHVQKS
jgi:hypothetical protein